jgi:tetratricopeptide (TPR) repeat protein
MTREAQSLLRAGLLCTLLLAPPLHAQEDARARVMAAGHFKRGVERASQHAYADALHEFEAAYRLVPREAVLYNIALAQAGLGRNADAMATLQHYLTAPASKQSDTQRAAAEALLEQLIKATQRAVATAQLTVVVFPYGKVWIDGELAGTSPLTQAVPIGAHHVTGGREQAELSQDVTLTAGAAQRVVLVWAHPELVPQSAQTAEQSSP